MLLAHYQAQLIALLKADDMGRDSLAKSTLCDSLAASWKAA